MRMRIVMNSFGINQPLIFMLVNLRFMRDGCKVLIKNVVNDHEVR